MLVNYYYECIRSHDSKPWRRVIGIDLKKITKKNPLGSRFVFFREAVKPAGSTPFWSFPPLQTLLAHGFVQ